MGLERYRRRVAVFYRHDSAERTPPPPPLPSLTDIKIGPVNEPIASSRTKHLAPPPPFNTVSYILTAGNTVGNINYILLFNSHCWYVLFSPLIALLERAVLWIRSDPTLLAGSGSG